MKIPTASSTTKQNSNNKTKAKTDTNPHELKVQEMSLNASKKKRGGDGGGDVGGEEQLRARGVGRISPEDVLRLPKAAKDYLCNPHDNVYGIDFVEFKIREMESGETLFHLQKPEEQIQEEGTCQDACRFVHYDFPRDILRLKSIGTTVVFVVGDKPVKDFRMIERHYFKDKLIKSFDFNFPFCIPNSTNSCEHIYELPKLSEAE
eukprot:Nk52_evm1s468 gene=Nk52_evmTU1s468